MTTRTRATTAALTLLAALGATDCELPDLTAAQAEADPIRGVLALSGGDQ